LQELCKTLPLKELLREETTPGGGPARSRSRLSNGSDEGGGASGRPAPAPRAQPSGANNLDTAATKMDTSSSNPKPVATNMNAVCGVRRGHKVRSFLLKS